MWQLGGRVAGDLLGVAGSAVGAIIVVMDIELGDAVAAWRDELLDAADRATTAEVEFAVGPIELEFTVELKFNAKANAGCEAWVVSADAEAGVSRTSKHKVSITLAPRRPGGGDLLVSRRSGPDGPGVTERGAAWSTSASSSSPAWGTRARAT